MYLSDVADSSHIVRDAEFGRLGYAFTPGVKILVFAGSRHFLVKATESAAVSAVIVPPALVESVPEHMGVLVGDSPRDLFFEIHEHLVNQMPAPQAAALAPEVDIHPTAVIHPAARIGRGARIAEFVVVRARVTIGADVTIEPGAKVGVDGILHRMVNGRQRLIPHAGRVLIGDGAMLMSNSTVVSAIFPDDSTVVGEGSLLGMNAVVGHEAFVGCNCVVSNDVVLARRAKVSDRAFIGTSAVIREYVSIGADARVMAGSVVIADVAAGGAVSGNFATDHGSRLREFARSHVQVTDHRRTSDDHS